MDFQQIQEFTAQYRYYLMAGNLVVGILFGLIPFFLGRKRGLGTLGTIGLIVSGVVALPSFLLGVLSAAIFSTIIIIRGKTASPSE